MLRGYELEDLVGLDRGPRGQAPSQCLVDHFEAFVLGGVQELQVLLDGRSFRRAALQLVVSHAKPCRRVHVVHIFVVGKRPWLADQRVDHVTKVDRFFAAAELPRHALDALILIPQFKMVLVNANLQLQADILAAYRIDVLLHANDTVGLDRHRHRSASGASLGREWIQRRGFFTKQLVSGAIAPRGQLTCKCREVVDVVEVATSTQSQRLVKCIFEVTMRRLNVAVLMRLANVDPMAFEPVVIQ